MRLDLDMNHIKHTDLTYWQHMFRALKMARVLFCGSLLTIVHAVLPWIFTRATTHALDACEDILITKLPK